MIGISIAPNFDRHDALRALRLVFQPWRWQNGPAQKALQDTLRQYFSSENVYTISSGRWGLYQLLKKLNLPAGSEVLLQAFTCVSVPGPVLWAGLKPVYVDTLSEQLTMDPSALKKQITPHSKVLIIQHTFGIAAKLDELLVIAREHHLTVIEDCAHTIGGKYQGKLLGTFGDAAILSFGRDKAISAVFGGAIIVNSPEKFAGNFYDLPVAPRAWIFQQLLHPIFTVLAIKPLYFIFGIGKIKLMLAQKLHLLSKALSKEERRGGKPKIPCARMPNALSELALGQWQRLPQMNDRRAKIVDNYRKYFAKIAPANLTPVTDKETFLLRYPIFVSNPANLLQTAKKQKMLLGDWYEVVAPKDTDIAAIGYQLGSCPNAEKVSAGIINLPTNFTLRDTQVGKIANFVINNATYHA